MAKNRYVNTKIWDDTYIISINPPEKLLFIYFLTNALTNISGMYEISKERMVFDTKIKLEDINPILKMFEKDKNVIYRDNWICIVNFIKNKSLNPSVFAGIERDIQLVQSKISKIFITGCDSLRQAGTLNLTLSHSILSNTTKRKKAFFNGNEMRYKKSEKKWYVIIDNEWKEFAGKESDIEYK